MSGRRPVFSVIVPAYNSEDYIDKCIESVLSQTYRDFELVLVDDGSKDQTLVVCEDYAQRDDRVLVIHQENGGHTCARNAGLHNSRGQYVLFLDSDDWLDTDTLVVCEKEIVAHTPDILVYGIRNTATGKLFPNYISDGYYTIKDSENSIFDTLLMSEDGTFAFQKCLNGKIFKREIVWENQLHIPSDILIGEDGACFVGAMLDAKTVSVLSDVCYNYLVRIGSVSHSSDKYSLRRCRLLLQYYREMFEKKDIHISDQFDRFVVAQLYTAVLFVMRSNCERAWLKAEFANVAVLDYVKAALHNARFNRKGIKLKVKQWILRLQLWNLVSLLDK